MAVGLCVLSLVLLSGGFGETVATADTGADGSVTDTHGVGDQGEDVTTATEPTEADRKYTRDGFCRYGSGALRGVQ